MVSLLVLAMMLMHPGTLGELRESFYDVSMGCGFTYGIVVDSLNNVVSFIKCCSLCSTHGKCLSVKYDLVSKGCHLNSERYLSLGTCVSMVHYGTLKKHFSEKLINQECTSSFECAVPNSMCDSNESNNTICMCLPGYSYKYTNESCVTSCDVGNYGSTFTAHYGYNIVGYNDKTLRDSSGDECMQLCAAETDFLCLSVDYWPEKMECYLSVETALTVPGRFFSDGIISHYHRNCLNPIDIQVQMLL